MQLRKYYLLIIYSLVLIVGCKSSQTGPETTGLRQVVITSANMSQISDKKWMLKHLAFEGKDYQLKDVTPHIKFNNDGKVSGFASVNRYFGRVDIDDQGSVAWPPLMSTRMSGPEDLMQLERAFLKALALTTRMTLQGTQLYLQNKDGQTKCLFSESAE